MRLHLHDRYERVVPKELVMPEDEARTLLRLIEHRVTSTGIEVRYRDVLIRLRAMIEDDLDATAGGTGQGSGGHPLTGEAA